MPIKRRIPQRPARPAEPSYAVRMFRQALSDGLRELVLMPKHNSAKPESMSNGKPIYRLYRAVQPGRALVARASWGMVENSTVKKERIRPTGRFVKARSTSRRYLLPRLHDAVTEGRGIEGIDRGNGVFVYWIGATPKPDRPLCGARTRAGGTCKARCVDGMTKCRMHGGLSTGPKTEAGRAAICESNRRRAGARRAADSEPATILCADKSKLS